MEQDVLVFLGIFALIGAVLKLFVLTNVSIKSEIAESFVIVCILFLCQNVAEFLGYFTYNSSESLAALFLDGYMITLYFTFPAVLVLALTLAEFKYRRVAKYGLYSIAALISAAHAGGYMVSGMKLVGWSAVTTPGPYYWAGMSFILLCAVSIPVYLAVQCIANSNFEVRSRCKVNLVAFGPLFAVAILVLLFRLAGFDSSSAVSLPLATMFFLVVMLMLTNNNIFWASLRLKILMSVLTLKNINTLDEILGRIEKLRITEALRASNGMQRNAAKLLSVPPSTLNKKIAKYDICVDDYQSVSVVQAIKARRQLAT